MFHQILPDTLVQAGGWTILHSLWQGAVITLLLAFILGRTRDQSPALRYNLSVGALLLLLGAVATTFLIYYEPTSGATESISGIGVEGLGLLSAAPPVVTASGTELPGQLFPFLLQIWVVGVALMGLRMLAEFVYLQRLRSANTQLVNDSWQERMNKLKWQMGILQAVELRESLRVNSPMLVGWIKPVILLPVGMLSGLSTQQVECVLAHELAHIQRFDYLVNLVQSAVEVLLFFNPAVWWISAQIREEREHCCDEMAVRLTGDRLTLVKTLAQLEEWRIQGGQLGLAFNGRPQGILGRVQRLLGGESSVRIIGKGLWSLLFFCMATGLLAFKGQDEDTDPNYQWEAIEIIEEQAVKELPAVSSFASRAETQEVVEYLEVNTEIKSPASIAARASELPPVLPEEVAQRQSEELSSLLAAGISLSNSLRDTTPDEKSREQMQVLQQAIEQLQQEMMNSAEMQRIQEITQKYEVEMQLMQEKIMKEYGGYEAMMQEQQKVMQKIEQRHQELMQSETYQAFQKEMEKISREYAGLTDELRESYEESPRLLEQKLDSLSRIYEKQHETLEKQYNASFRAIEEELEVLENSPEMKALEEKMTAMDQEMEKLMAAKVEPMEAEMEKLQKVMEEQFEQQMRVLEEKLEKLERMHLKRENRRQE